MSTRILTLFGEEIVPEPQKPAGRGRAKKTEQAEEPTADAVPADNTATEPSLTAESTATEGAALAISASHTEVEAPPAIAIPEPTETHEAPGTIEPETPAEAVATEEVPRLAENTFASENLSVPGETTLIDATPQAQEPLVAEMEMPEVELPAAEESTATAKPAKKSRKRSDADGLLAKPGDEIIPEDWSGNKNYYAIGEVAGFFKVNTSHIRFWTNEFKLKVRTTRKGDRLYTPEQVKELRAIYHLVKERGFTLSGAKTKLKTQNKRDVATVDLKTSLQELRTRLVKLRDQLV